VKYTAGTFQNDAMMVCLEKIFIQQNVPAGMKQFPAAIGEKGHHTSF
jgi:hypothetical protein